jgi:photosystem II stability/assembly factor-like uncharacterized protein
MLKVNNCGSLIFGCVAVLILSAGCAQSDAPAPSQPIEKDFVKTTNITYGPWRSGVVGGGGYIQNVVTAPTNKNRYYTYVDVGGLSRSDDGGNTWKMLHGHLPPALGNYEVRGLVVDPRDDKKIIIATGSQWDKKQGIYISSDAGETFQKTLDASFFGNGPNRPSGFILARDPKNPDVVVTAAVLNGVFISRDNGVTWKPSSSGSTGFYSSDIRFDRTNSKRLWLCATAGKIWDKQYPAAFLRSEDGGDTWTKLLDEAPSEIIQDPKDGATIYGIFKTEIIKKSTDGGATWIDFSDGLLIEPAKPGEWKSLSKSQYQALAAGPDFILTCNTRDADFYKLTSGSTKWEKIARNAPEVGDWYLKGAWYFGGAAGSITVDPNDPDHWFMTDFFAIYQTHDAGKNWRLTIDGMEVTVSHTLQQDPTDPAIMHLGVADVGAFSSTDGGVRFQRSKVPDTPGNPAGGGNMKCIDLCPKMPNRLYGVANKNYYLGWAANQVYISNDRGKVWTRSPMTGLPANTFCTTTVADWNDPNTVYLTVGGQVKPNGGGVYKSTDAGASWTWMGDGLPLESWYFPNDIWVHGRQLAASTDGSLISVSKVLCQVHRYDPKTAKWEKISLYRGGAIWCVVADPLKAGRYFVAIRSDGLYRTDDGGVTWKKVYNKSVSYVATDGAVPGRVAGGTSDGVILSTDGGETWKEMDKSLPYRVDNIVAFAGERLFAASLGSGVFWMPISPAGEKPITAKPLVAASPP